MFRGREEMKREMEYLGEGKVRERRNGRGTY